ncbi:MAG: protein phosphatase 2C domain-containing protein [Gemmataceae bacterium]
MADTNKGKVSGWMARLMNTADEEAAPAARPETEIPDRTDSAEKAQSKEKAGGNGAGSAAPFTGFPNLELPERGPETAPGAAPAPLLPPALPPPLPAVPLEVRDVAIAQVVDMPLTGPLEDAPTELLPAAQPVVEAGPAEDVDETLVEEEEALVEEEEALAVEAPAEEEAAPAAAPIEEAPAGPTACPCCGAGWSAGSNYCADCGFMLPATFVASSPNQKNQAARVAAMPQPKVRLKNRFEVGDLIQERQGICRYRGTDHGATGPKPITIVWGPVTAAGGSDNPFDEVPVATIAEEDDVLPTFDDVAIATPALVDASGKPIIFPSVAWEKMVLEKVKDPAIPAVIDHFVDNNFEYLIIDAPAGRSLWEAWDEPEAGEAAVRYGWLKQVAQGLHALHQAGAMIEGIRPDLINVNAAGQAVITDLSDLLPIPVPPGAPIRGTLYTAPELMLSPGEADGRADLYSFGAMLYSLEFLHHALEEKNFERQFTPKSIVDEGFPDVHPLFLRLVNKTFVRDLHVRFPTDEAQKTDPTGAVELIKTLEIMERTFDRGRLDIASWTTTGMVRTGNEDAFTVLHGVDSRLDDVNECAMLLLADGMGGYEAGEVAAALCLNELRTYLLQQPIFAALTGGAGPAGPVNADAYKQVMQAALKHANKVVYTTSRTPGKGKRGMGCTAEAVYVDSRNVIAGHVGDSRVYHVSQGRLVQLTRDQTLVNRLVELGQLSEAEAEDHPRKNELQQAIGGQPDVVPGLYSGKLKRGDWVLVCSDGVTNHINNKELEQMLTREAYDSADTAARRLVNLVNLRGATDNSTVVVIRVC